jgi:hypothetical protein
MFCCDLSSDQHASVHGRDAIPDILTVHQTCVTFCSLSLTVSMTLSRLWRSSDRPLICEHRFNW